MSMVKTIFRNAFLVGISVLIFCAALFLGMQYTRTMEETYAAFRQEALYAEQGVMQGGIGYLNSIDFTDRITWIASDGSVLFDSEFELPIANQKDFSEVRSAFESGEGHGSRKSESNGESTAYFAILCEDGTVLRFGRPLSAVRNALIAVSPVFWILILVLIISGVLSFRAARQIVKPINEIDLDRPDSNVYPEITPLIDKIREQKLTIEEEIMQREQMRREFSANVSHELKTPLTSISGFAELMAKGLVDEERMREFSMDIYKESQRTITLVDDIIKLSKLDEGGVDPEWETVDLYNLSASVIESLSSIAQNGSVTLSLTGEKAPVRGVYRLLYEMVYNLLDNAIKYNRRGGKAEIKVEKRGDKVELSVTDTGIGIPEEHQKRVFERFYRVDKSHSKEIGGTGLGLSIVKHGALFHGAETELESEPGVGTTVRLIFPANGQGEK